MSNVAVTFSFSLTCQTQATFLTSSIKSGSSFAFPSIYAFDAQQVSRYVHYRRAFITRSCFSRKTESDLIMMCARARIVPRGGSESSRSWSIRIAKILSPPLPRRAANVSCRYGKYEIISWIRTEIARRCRNLRSASDKPQDLALCRGNRWRLLFH